jgi:thiol:disulfide interchange protein
VRRSLRSYASLALALWLVTASAGCSAEPGAHADESIEWVNDHADGLRLARDSGRPAFVFFTADWCGPCVEMKKTLWKDRRVVAASRKLVAIYLDVDKDPESFAAYKVRGIPAVVFLSPQGERTATFTGERSAANLARQMNAVAATFSK